MSSIFELKEQIVTLYAGKSKIIDKILKLILGLFVFAYINNNAGFMKVAASPLVTVGLAVVCAFLPLLCMVLVAAALLLAHLFSLSIGLMAVAAASILLMFVCYFRFTPKQALILLLTPVLFWLKIPYVMPIAYGLIGAPISMVPIACGTVLYYIVDYAKDNASTLTGGKLSGILDVITTCAKQIYQNKGMWVTVAAFAICICLVYTIKRQAIENSWKIAIISGAIVNIVVSLIGNTALHVKSPIAMLILGNAVAVIVCMILELFVFSVDYSRAENIEFEDDEYFYYVKAVPKISVARGQKTVKKIQGHYENAEQTSGRRKAATEAQGDETMVIDSNQVEAQVARQQASKRRATTANGHARANQELLKQSLKDELHL